MAVPVMCIIMVPFVWNRDMRSLTIAFVSCIMYIFMLISIQGNHIYYHVNNVLEEVGISSYHDAISSAKFQINKIANRAARVKIGHVSNKEESLGNKINVLDIKHDNFYYAIPLKIVLQVVAPFPIDRYSNFYDLMNRINGFIYTLLLPFAALSVIGYTTRNDDTNFGRQYLNNYKIILSYFFLLSIAVAFSGPWLSPRYRIMLSGILLIIATIGLSNLNKQQKTSVFMVTLIVTSTVHMYYQNIKVFLLSLL